MTLSTGYYRQTVDLSNLVDVEAKLNEILNTPVESVEALQEWLRVELEFSNALTEVLAGRTIDFYRDTQNEEKKERHMYDQTEIQPILTKYQALFDEKFCQCPWAKELDDAQYRFMRSIRATNLELFCEENIPLETEEQGLVAKYNEIIGGLSADWEGNQMPIPFIEAKLDNQDRTIREQAWHVARSAYLNIKPELDGLMDRLVQIRHQIAKNSGFDNYRDYAFRQKNREYTVEQCKQFHQAVEKYIVPVWDEISAELGREIGVTSIRPWDQSNHTLSGPSFTSVDALTSGVAKMLSRTDEQFAEIFSDMQSHELLDLESRSGKAPGGFCAALPISRASFVFANFSPSYFALIALVHEMGHAVNGRFQMAKEPMWSPHRAEVAELYSHGMELLCLDKLDEFYSDASQFGAAVKQRIRRSFTMLMGPLLGDLFQHWMYENPSHTASERDAKYRELIIRYSGHPVDWSGIEEAAGTNWIRTIHYFAYPFYNIEYSMAELGALQLLQNYQENKAQAIADYKRGAAANYNQSIADVYQETGVSFDFSDAAIESTAEFLRNYWRNISA